MWCVVILFFVLIRKKRKYVKKMFDVRLAGDHLFGKWLFTWLLLVMSLIVSYFVLSFFQEMS